MARIRLSFFIKLRDVSETLRKYPPAALLSRRCEYPYRLPGTQFDLPTGMRVVIPIYGIHHDPKYYPQPDKFNPDRFDDENKSSRHPNTYLPFGEGPRNCIGIKNTHIFLIHMIYTYSDRF